MLNAKFIIKQLAERGRKDGDTTNLNNHLKQNHAENKEVKLILRESEDSNKKISNPEQQLKLLSISLPASTLTFMDLSDSTSSSSSSSSSESESFEEGGTRAEEITNAIIFMIAKDNMPLQTVDNEGFKNLMKTIVPLYSVPERNSIVKKVKEKYEYIRACKKQKLEKIDYFSVTTDIWIDILNTGIQSCSYLGMTVHYEFEGELQATTIGVTEITKQHTSEDIGKWMKTILRDWHIDDEKIIVVVTNKKNIKKAVIDCFGSIRHIICFAHSIYLVAEDAINSQCVKPDCFSLCSKIETIVTYFEQSIIAANALRKLTHLKLIQTTNTRWNSKFAMLQRFTLLSKEVESILLSFPDSPKMLTASELQLANEIVKVLQPLEKLTREICGERFFMASKIIPLINCFKNKNKKLRESLKTETALSLVDCLQDSISRRFGQLEDNFIMATSTILDPRFKKLHFIQPLSCSNAIDRIATWMRELDQTNVSNQSNDTVAETSMEISDETDDMWSFHNDLLKSKTINVMPTDLKLYLNVPIIDRKEDPICYWTNFASIYPTLSVIAKKYLTIAGTSVSSKKLFLRDGNILTNSRNQLLPDHPEESLFLNSLSIKDWQLKDF